MYKKLLLEVIGASVSHYYNGACYSVELNLDKENEMCYFTAFYVKNTEYNSIAGIVTSVGTICVNKENETIVPWYTIN